MKIVSLKHPNLSLTSTVIRYHVLIIWIKKMLNLKVVVIKDLQFKNQKLRNEIINVESHWKKTII